MPEPTLWWPWALGDQAADDVTVEAIAEDGRVSHTVERTVGLRSLVFDDWQLLGQRRATVPEGRQPGPDPRPCSARPPTTTSAATSTWPARPASTWSGSTPTSPRPALYDQADERGMLVWQDLPLQWGYARSVRKQAVRQARKAVEILGHHPSVAIWCGHNEPLALDEPTGAMADPAVARRMGLKALAGRSCPPGTRPCSTARSSGPSRRPTAPAR